MTNFGDDLYSLYEWARATAWRYQLDQFETEALQSILATLDKGRREVMREFAARFANATLSDWQADRLEALLYEMQDLTAGVRSELTQQYTSMSVTVAAPTITETVGALSVGGLAQGVNNVALPSAQLRTFFQETPLGGRLIQDWVDRSFTYSVQGQIRQAINVGVLRGEGYPGLVRRVEDGFGMARKDAVTLTRTFVSAANNEARSMVYEANSDVVKGEVWHTAGDNRVCPICLALHGREFKLGEGPSRPIHPRCLTPETPVFAPDKIAAFVSTYSGSVFEIGLSDGRRLTATPNHMFLTPNGFTPAKLFRKGDNVFSGPVANGPQLLGLPNDYRNPSRIDEVVEAFSKTRGVSSARMPVSAEDLHGDGEFVKGDVDVIAPYSLLRGDFDAFLSEHGDKMPFPFAGHLDALPLDGLRFLSLPLFWLRYATKSVMRGLSVFEVLGRGAIGHHEAVGGCQASNLDVSGYEMTTHYAPGYTKRIGNSLFGFSGGIPDENLFNGKAFQVPGCKLGLPIDRFDTVPLESTRNCGDMNSILLSEYSRRFAGHISLANVEFVRERYFSGHVYDLQTVSTLYYVNGALSSNCRCFTLPKTITWRELGIPIDEMKREADRWIIRGNEAKDGEISVRNIDTGGKDKVLRVGRYATADDWFSNLSDAEKRSTSLGPRRVRLLEEGRISMKDLVGADYQPRTLKQLETIADARR